MQEILVTLTISAAVVYLTRRFWLTMKRKRKSGCEKCAMIPNHSSAKSSSSSSH